MLCMLKQQYDTWKMYFGYFWGPFFLGCLLFRVIRTYHVLSKRGSGNLLSTSSKLLLLVATVSTTTLQHIFNSAQFVSLTNLLWSTWHYLVFPFCLSNPLNIDVDMSTLCHPLRRPIVCIALHLLSSAMYKCPTRIHAAEPELNTWAFVS